MRPGAKQKMILSSISDSLWSTLATLFSATGVIFVRSTKTTWILYQSWAGDFGVAIYDEYKK